MDVSSAFRVGNGARCSSHVFATGAACCSVPCRCLASLNSRASMSEMEPAVPLMRGFHRCRWRETLLESLESIVIRGHVWKATGHCAGRPRWERGTALNGNEDSARTAAEQSGCADRHQMRAPEALRQGPGRSPAANMLWAPWHHTQEEPWKFTGETGKLHVRPLAR